MIPIEIVVLLLGFPYSFPFHFAFQFTLPFAFLFPYRKKLETRELE